ncbi:putative 2-aminoethylphosphonate ABC transporter permease subunit [Ideonella sp.]|uniref:putative 2-aminoethylphosphonate ABC transporter permease subunit n=1 Tax=Ideonella sp. TaxID=1929293 RepID=UPI0037BFC44B
MSTVLTAPAIASGTGSEPLLQRLLARLPPVLLLLMTGLLLLGIVLPMTALLMQSAWETDGQTVGLGHYRAFFAQAHVGALILRSVGLAAAAATLSVALAYGFAYALSLSAMPGKALFKGLALLPLMAPSLLMALSLVVLFGNQGLLRDLWQAVLGDTPFYGEAGMLLGAVLWTFPHALMMLSTTLSQMDGRLFEAAQTLGASPARQFWTITLPASRYGLMLAWMVVFVLVLTDFGVPKVLGGQDAVLATELYKQVIGQQNFRLGAVVAVLLLLPAVVASAVEAHLRRRQGAALTLRATPHHPKPVAWRDGALWIYCALVCTLLVGTLLAAALAALATYWPYDLSLSLRHFDFDNTDGGGWATFVNSLRLATWTALIGTACAFMTAWLVAKPRGFVAARQTLNVMAMLPLAIPGLALGLGYILFFNPPWQPLRGLYGGMAILVLCTVAHYFSVAHLTLLTALRQLDAEYEWVGESLGVSPLQTAWAVHLPACGPSLFEVAGFFFVNALTTVSAVVFLYGPDTGLASVAVLNMDDAGDMAPAAAMAMLIFLTAAAGRGLLGAAAAWSRRRTQAWRTQ